MRTKANVISRWMRIWLGVGLLVAVDHAVKLWALQHDQAVFNNGGILGLWPSDRWGIGLVIVIGAMIWWGLVHQLGRSAWAYWLVIAGGLSNVLDRFLYGAVVDMIRYPVINLYGNVADMYLAVGIGWILMEGIRSSPPERHDAEGEKADADSV